MVQLRELNENFKMIYAPGTIYFNPELYSVEKEYDYNCFAVIPVYLINAISVMNTLEKSDRNKIRDFIATHLITLN